MRVEQLTQRVVPMVPLEEACCLAIALVPVFSVRILHGSSTVIHVKGQALVNLSNNSASTDAEDRLNSSSRTSGAMTGGSDVSMPCYRFELCNKLPVLNGAGW